MLSDLEPRVSILTASKQPLIESSSDVSLLCPSGVLTAGLGASCALPLRDLAVLSDALSARKRMAANAGNAAGNAGAYRPSVVEVIVTAEHLESIHSAYDRFKFQRRNESLPEVCFGFELGRMTWVRLSELCRGSGPEFEEVSGLLRAYVADVSSALPTFFPEGLSTEQAWMLDDLLAFVSREYCLALHPVGSVRPGEKRPFVAKSVGTLLALCFFVGVEHPGGRPPRQFVVRDSQGGESEH